jgi:hypothetical protein
VFELVAWLEIVLVGTAASIPLWLCVLAAVCVALVCASLVVGGEEADVSNRRWPSRACEGKEENAKRAAVALRVLLGEIKDEGDRRDVEHAARIALVRSRVLEADES